MRTLAEILLNLELTKEEILEEADLLEQEQHHPSNRKHWLSLEGYSPDQIREAAEVLYPVTVSKVA